MDINRLIEQIREGDPSAGPILVSILAPRLLGYANQVASDLGEADREAIVEAAIETAIGRIDRYDSMKGTFPAWVRTFVFWAAQDWRRDHPTQSSLSETAEPLPPAPDVETDEATDDTPNMVSGALTALVLTEPESSQLLLRLRFAEHLTHEQIAAQLGISPHACRKRLERLLRRLRERASTDDDLKHLNGEDHE